MNELGLMINDYCSACCIELQNRVWFIINVTAIHLISFENFVRNVHYTQSFFFSFLNFIFLIAGGQTSIGTGDVKESERESEMER